MALIERVLEARVEEMIDEMWRLTAAQNNISVDDAKMRFFMRQLWAEDFDGMSESDYSYAWSTDGDQTTAANRFYMEPIDKFECVGVYGWMNGNCSTTINHIEAWIGETKKREWFGQQLSAEENDLTIFMDPVIAVKTHNFKVIPNTTSASATSKAFPLGLVIKAK